MSEAEAFRNTMLLIWETVELDLIGMEMLAVCLNSSKNKNDSDLKKLDDDSCIIPV
mgnify:CR=1 FL=1